MSDHSKNNSFAPLTPIPIHLISAVFNLLRCVCRRVMVGRSIREIKLRPPTARLFLIFRLRVGTNQSAAGRQFRLRPLLSEVQLGEGRRKNLRVTISGGKHQKIPRRQWRVSTPEWHRSWLELKELSETWASWVEMPMVWSWLQGHNW